MNSNTRQVYTQKNKKLQPLPPSRDYLVVTGYGNHYKKDGNDYIEHKVENNEKYYYSINDFRELSKTPENERDLEDLCVVCDARECYLESIITPAGRLHSVFSKIGSAERSLQGLRQLGGETFLEEWEELEERGGEDSVEKILERRNALKEEGRLHEIEKFDPLKKATRGYDLWKTRNDIAAHKAVKAEYFQEAEEKREEKHKKDSRGR